MTVGQNIRNRKLLQPRRTRRLDNSDECNIMRGQLVKFNLQLLHIARSVMRRQNAVGNGLLLCLRRTDTSARRGLQLCRRVLIRRNNHLSADQIGTLFV